MMEPKNDLIKLHKILKSIALLLVTSTISFATMLILFIIN